MASVTIRLKFNATSGLTGSMAMALAGGLVPTADAQTAGDFQLPAGTPSPTPRPPGPVDTDVPPPRAVTPTPTPTPSVAPGIILPSPSPSTPRPKPSAAPRAAETPRAAIAATPSPQPSASAPDPLPLPSESSAVAPVPVPEAPMEPPTDIPAAAAPSAWAIWAGLAVALLALAGAALAWARRNKRTAQPDFVPPVVPLPEPEPAPEFAVPAPAIPAVAFQPEAREPLHFSLEATRLSATLVNATLSYRLTVSNGGHAPLTDIAVGGDMISAHASRPMEEQLGLSGPDLPALHRIPMLAPGEQLVLAGDIRLPLTAITPIRNGAAQLFVPLARFDAWATALGGSAVRARAAFLVGQMPQPAETATSRLQPFRLDLGPRVYAQLGQRTLAVPATD